MVKIEPLPPKGSLFLSGLKPLSDLLILGLNPSPFSQCTMLSSEQHPPALLAYLFFFLLHAPVISSFSPTQAMFILSISESECPPMSPGPAPYLQLPSNPYLNITPPWKHPGPQTWPRVLPGPLVHPCHYSLFFFFFFIILITWYWPHLLSLHRIRRVLRMWTIGLCASHSGHSPVDSRHSMHMCALSLGNWTILGSLKSSLCPSGEKKPRGALLSSQQGALVGHNHRLWGRDYATPTWQVIEAKNLRILT